MTDVFEKLRIIAEKEFGCTLVQGEQKLDFKSIFGVRVEEIKEIDTPVICPPVEAAVYAPVDTQLKDKEIETFVFDFIQTHCICIAA